AAASGRTTSDGGTDPDGGAGCRLATAAGGGGGGAAGGRGVESTKAGAGAGRTQALAPAAGVGPSIGRSYWPAIEAVEVPVINGPPAGVVATGGGRAARSPVWRGCGERPALLPVMWTF